MQTFASLASRGYDDRDRLVSKQTPWGTLTYGYGADGNLASIRSSNANGVSIEYDYDELNRLETVTDERMGGAATSYRYDEIGNLAGYTYANGVRTDYVYNSLNRLETVTMKDAGAATLASFGYTLGAAGNRTGVTEASGRTVGYTYDDLYRLTAETIASDPNSANGEIGYVYDDVGNRLSRTSTHPAIANQTASYDANDRVAAEQYDANGNTVGASGQGYGWDAENRLTVLNAGTAGEVRYAYDGDGNRVAKTEGGVTTRYLVDTMNPTGYAQTVEELTESAGQAATVTRRYAYGLDLISQEQVIGGMWTASWYGYDGHGNVRSLTDAAGAVTDRYDYDAYGALISSVGSTPNEYLYTGERFDPALGFYYLRARYLNPNVGRFVGMDSYGGVRTDPGSLHKYLYAGNQPVDFLDPSGHMTLAQQVQVGAIIGIVVSLATFIGFASLANYYLPSDAFTTMPDASVIGFQVSYPIGRAIRRVHDSPLSLGLSIGLLLTAGIGGLDLVMPLGKPNTAWAYAYAGLSVGFGQELRGRSMNGYVGFVWNVKTASDYAGPFFGTTVTPGSAVSSLIGARFPGRSVTVSSSPPKADGTPGAYAATIGIESAHQKTAQASGTYYNYLGDVGASMHPHDSTSDGGSIDLLVSRWYSLADELYPE